MKNVLLIVLIFFFTKNIFGSCGSSSCPLHINNSLSKGLLSLSLSYEYINQNQIYVGSSKAFVGAIHEHHDEVSTLNQITAFSVGYGINDFLKVYLSVPIIKRKHTHIHNHHGEQLLQNWNYSGLGDATLTGSFSIMDQFENDFGLEFNAGIKLPTGITDMANQAGDLAEVTIQPGTGSTDLILGASVSKNIMSLPTLAGSSYSAFPLLLNVNYKINGKGTLDYQFGNELLVHLSTAYRFFEKISLLFQVNGRFQGHADVGITGEPEGNTGGEWLFASPGLKFHLSDYISLYGYIQLPVYQNVNGIQQAAPFNLQFGISNEINLL